MSAVYKLYENSKGVSTIYISEEMFGLMSTFFAHAEETGVADMLVGDIGNANVEISNFLDSLTNSGVCSSCRPMNRRMHTP